MTQDEQQQVNAMMLVALLVLAGCATSEPYWIRVAEPVLLTDIRIVDKPCGRADWLACNNRYTGVIQLQRGMREAQHWCVLEHEKKHLAGYNHPKDIAGAQAIDCGNGEML